jgi:hypothetical protein
MVVLIAEEGKWILKSSRVVLVTLIICSQNILNYSGFQRIVKKDIIPTKKNPLVNTDTICAEEDSCEDYYKAGSSSVSLIISCQEEY